jgi:hypothetical protein
MDSVRRAGYPAGKAILGSGIRGSKVPTASDKLQSLSNAKVLDISKK